MKVIKPQGKKILQTSSECDSPKKKKTKMQSQKRKKMKKKKKKASNEKKFRMNYLLSEMSIYQEFSSISMSNERLLISLANF